MWWLCATALLLAACNPSDDKPSQSYPHKPVKIIVPFGAGGGSDQFVRVVQKTIRDENLLPQPLVVINVPGAGGSIGSRRVKDALADGYTLLNLHEGIITAKYAGITPYGPEAFTPIAATGTAGMVVCVDENSPHQDLASLMETAGAEPDTIVFGANVGAPSYFAGRQLEAQAPGSAFRYVQTGGGAKRFASLQGGHIDATAFSISEYFQFRDAGIRALAFLGQDRHPEAPDLPTATEQGYDVVSSGIQFWWAPRGTPQERIEVFADALERAMNSEALRETLAEMKVDPVVLRGDALRREIDRREKAIASVGIAELDRLPNLPNFLIVILSLCAAWILIDELRKNAGRSSREPNSSSAPLRWPLMIAVLLLSAAYVLAMQIGRVSFPVATLVYVPLLGLAWLKGRPIGIRPVFILVGAGLALGFGCFYLFTQVLVIDLP
ncbi:MAG: tripartite tricarboxylate transporter substrate-binding protein [Verrucomicrobiota bacterium]